MRLGRRDPVAASPKYPGRPTVVDGSEAVVATETAASEAAAVHPVAPSTRMSEGWIRAVAEGRSNVFGRRLLGFDPEGDPAAAAVTAGMSLAGLRAAGFSSGQGIAAMHESLYPAAGKRLTYVLNLATRALAKQALPVQGGHDDYHAVDDTGFFQLFAADAQEAADLDLIAHRVAELALNPGIVAQDGDLTGSVLESVRLAEPELIREFLGDPADSIESPTAAQRLVFGERRRRIPESFDLDRPMALGVGQGADSYGQGVAAQRPFYFEHVAALADRAMAEFQALTGRRYARASGYRMEEADYVILAQGSIVRDAEVVADHLRRARRLRVGVVNLTMFRPFPADLVIELLRRRKAVVVLERVDQPLAADPPLLREVRVALAQAVENGRAGNGTTPYPGLAALRPEQVPDLYSGCFGLGGRETKPGDLVAAVENMAETGRQLRRFYLGIDFVRPGTRLPKLEIWQQQLLDSYPELERMALHGTADLALLPPDAVAVRIHSLGGTGGVKLGRRLVRAAGDLAEWQVKAGPAPGSEKNGHPTAFQAILARERIRTNGRHSRVDVALSLDPGVFHHADPLAGLADDGACVVQSDREPADVWAGLPPLAQREIRGRGIRLFVLDGFAGAESDGADRASARRRQHAAFLGAFFKVAPFLSRTGLDEAELFERLEARLATRRQEVDPKARAAELAAIRRGFDEVRPVDYAELTDRAVERGALPVMPSALAGGASRPGWGGPGRFWEQVGFLYQTGSDGLADPFAALGAMPAATSAIRDLTPLRREVPVLVADRCTGCGECWAQCPDAALPALVHPVDQLLEAAIQARSEEQTFDRLRPVLKPLARELRRVLAGSPGTFAEALTAAYDTTLDRMNLDPERRAHVDAEFAPVAEALGEFPLAKTAAFFDEPEARQPGTGGLLSIVVHPEACKGCNLCVEVCPEEALVAVRQDDAVVDRLRRNRALWERLPDTDQRYLETPLPDGGAALVRLLLSKVNYGSLGGGDGACPGCGEKTTLHLVYSAVTAFMQPKVRRHVERLDELIARLDEKARDLLSADADLDRVQPAGGRVDLPLAPDKQSAVDRISRMLRDLKELRWRYGEGPAGKGRAALGIVNATGCSSTWGATYPYNVYPVPWVSHLVHDAPSIAIGLFEGQMRKMADGFRAVRRAELELDGEYDPTEHEPFLAGFDWHQFSDQEFQLCPPLFAIGGDGALGDVGLQSLSRLLASGKPIRVVVLDTQAASDEGGSAGTGSYGGQQTALAGSGSPAGRGEGRKELALLVMAHRNAYLLQASQANPSHLLAGVLRGLETRRPAVFVLHCPCLPVHGLADNGAYRAARLAVESRAFPVLRYDPEAGPSMAERLSLAGNPVVEATWTSYELRYQDEHDRPATVTLPLTVADWAATEGRFGSQFTPLAETDPDPIPLHGYLDLSPDEREGRTPCLSALDSRGRLTRYRVSGSMVELAEERVGLWNELRELAGLKPSRALQAGFDARLEAELATREKTLRAEYETQLAELRARYPRVIARRLAQGLLRAEGGRTIEDILAEAATAPVTPLPPIEGDAPGNGAPSASVAVETPAAPAPPPAAAPEPAAAAPTPAPPPAEEELVLEAYIESSRCTSCDECLNANRKIFAYNDRKQAFIKDPKAGPFKDLVLAAEKCPVGIIHPGAPLDANEKDLAKWVKRAEKFN